MNHQPRYESFIFESYGYEPEAGMASFRYSFDNERHFTERVVFEPQQTYDEQVLDRALWLAFLVVGTSYYKCFPGARVEFSDHTLTLLDVELLTAVYRDGLSQFVFENNISPEILPTFRATGDDENPSHYNGKGTLALQSGGKDSLLLAELIKQRAHPFETVYMSSSESYPHVIDQIQQRPPRIMRRMIDHDALVTAQNDGALNGHVPVTYITYSLALIDAVLHSEDTVLAAVGREGNEAHEFIGDFAINHQWSKTWQAEILLARYVAERIAPELRVGSPLRCYSELRVAELFVQTAWRNYGHSFSSCNLANYAQGKANNILTWCGECPKCANSFVLFAPFVEPEELMNLFGGQNLFAKPSLTDTFKGLLGIDGVMKPFECVGEIDELRRAYHMARDRYGDVYELPFDVPPSSFDYLALGPMQPWAENFIS